MAETKETFKELPFHLVVKQPFGDYKRGAKITDTQTIKQVLDGENAHFCNKVLKKAGE